VRGRGKPARERKRERARREREEREREERGEREQREREARERDRGGGVPGSAIGQRGDRAFLKEMAGLF